MPRSYNKSSPYWANRKAASVQSTQVVAAPQSEPIPHHGFETQFVGDRQEIFAAGGVSNASCGQGRGTEYMNNWAPAITNYGLYPNLSRGIMPFSAGAGGQYTMEVPINLATLAYFNIALVRNAINLLRDFSISPLHINSDNTTVQTFFTKWFEAINLNDLMTQFFLEYYRSGNVFIYKFNGKIADDKLAKMKTAMGEAMAAVDNKSPEIPIRYIILDPKQVNLQVGPNYNNTYVRMLSTFELQRLRDPKTPEDRQVLRSFPPDIQKQIKSYGSQPWIYVPLDTSRLYYCFNGKQDYEPLAVPPINALLPRLEYKMMLETADMSLVQTMSQVFMLITAGYEPDKNKGVMGPSKAQLDNLTNIFQNQTLGRYLVTDGSVKADWKIPDLKELLGKGKYEQVDKDIREGLGYQFFGEEKFANALVKAKLFTESLREGRRVFLENFLMPEVRSICKAMGFRHVPTLQFEDIDVSDKSALQRLYVQMGQLGLLTAPEVNQALEEGILPTKEQSEQDQAEYTKLRAKGFYTPLAPPAAGDQNGRPNGTGTKMPGKKVGTRAGYSLAGVVDTIKAMTDLEESFQKILKKKCGVKRLNEAQIKFAREVTKAIVVNETPDKWDSSLETYLTEPKNMPHEVIGEITQIAVETNSDPFTAIALYRNKVEQNDTETGV